MPLVRVEEVASFVISDDRTKDHLRRCENARSRQGFREYCAQFGIHDLGEVTEYQMFSLIAARNTAPIIDLLQIPGGKDSKGKDDRSYDLRRRKTTLGPAIQSFLDPVPSHDQEWEVLRDPEDIPEAIPEDLLLRRLAPKEFLRRLAEGELLRSAWVQDDLDDLLHAPIEAPEESLDPNQDSGKEDKHPFGYLLLDASDSMGTGRDRRDEVARGIALAFLRTQFEAGNPTYLYLFSHELSPAFGGESRAAFESAVAAILAHPYQGMTNLQGSLKLLAERMLLTTERVDIALITDGVTRMTECPLGDAHLHTFLVGVTPEEFDPFAAGQYQDSLVKLNHWSDFMFRIDPSLMASASTPRREDVLDFGKILYGIETEIASVGSAGMCKRVFARIWNLLALIARYKEHNGAVDPEVDELFTWAKNIHGSVAAHDPSRVAFDNAAKWTPVERDLTLAVEQRELRTIFDDQEISIAVVDKTQTSSANLFEALAMLLKAIKRLLRRRRRRILQR